VSIISESEYLKSLESARLVQLGLLPKKRHLNKVIPNSFVIYEPKDYVSGDFYWVGNKNDLSYIVLGDCTGHGISAALLSVLALNLFEYVIMNKGLKRVDKILCEVDKKFIESFKGEEDILDNPWIDLAIVAIDKENNKLYFSSANRKALLVKKNGHDEIFKGSKYPIGGWQIEKERSFAPTIIPFQKGDIIYLGSDGFQDQIGGTRGKKYKSKQLHQLLVQISQLPLSLQKSTLEKELKSWKGKESQTDDVCLMGIRL
jgi:serine phosphatase RsbU (regulator of sigma subunit)